VEEAYTAIAKAIARISRNRKVLELANKRVRSKAICLLNKLEEEEEAKRKANGSLSNGEIVEANAGLSS
jgi:hypothetical protein